MNVFKLPVHPAADVLPMLDSDELAALASDIKESGQRFPVVVAEVEGELMLLDGRNRKEACKAAGIEPVVEQLSEPLTDAEARAFVISANTRRNISKGIKAMCFAIIQPEGGKGGRGKKASPGGMVFSKQMLSKARIVYHHAPDLVEPVKSGAKKLNEAYDEARRRKRVSETVGSRLDALREKHPDLATLVTEETLSLETAEQEAQQREEAERHRLEIIDALFERVLHDAELTNDIKEKDGAYLKDIALRLPAKERERKYAQVKAAAEFICSVLD